MKARTGSARSLWWIAWAWACACLCACSDPVASQPHATNVPARPADAQSARPDAGAGRYALDTSSPGAPALYDAGGSARTQAPSDTAAPSTGQRAEARDGGTHDVRVGPAECLRDGPSEMAPLDAEYARPRDSGADRLLGGDVQDRVGVDRIDGCSGCTQAADHLLITEIAIGPAGAEFVELLNPTSTSVDLSDYAIADTHRYAEAAAGVAAAVVSSDFAAQFPAGARLGPGAYATVSIDTTEGHGTSFRSLYGQPPDYEVRPGTEAASDEPSVPNLRWVTTSSTIGSSASLTDTGEPIVLFRIRADRSVDDVDYVFYGRPTSANPAVDKTGVAAAGRAYGADRPESAQRPVPSPLAGGSLQRCNTDEPSEPRDSMNSNGSADGSVPSRTNGISGHDETGEDWQRSFVPTTAERRTPGRGPPTDLCP